MSTFATMLPGFRDLCVALTGLQVEQKNSPPKMIDPRAKGRLEMRVIACRSVSAVGDEIRYTYDAGTGAFTMSSEGARMITIQVKFEGFDHGPSQDALYYLERLGNRMVWPSSQVALKALDLGLVNRGTFQDFSDVMSAENRQWSVGVKDFMFLAVVNENPDNPADNPSNWIESVTVTSHYLDESMDPQIVATVTRP